MGGCPDSGFWGSAGDRGFGAEPVIEVVPVLEAAGLIQFIRTAADLFFKIRVGCKCSRRHRGRMLRPRSVFAGRLAQQSGRS